MPTDGRDVELATTVDAGSEAEPAPRLAVGTVIGHFVIDQPRPLGGGGVGIVYSARDAVLQRQVAIKVLRRDLASDRKEPQTRLLREARAASAVVHENVVTVYEAGFYDEQVFIVMELVDGGSLTAWLAERPRGWKEVVPIFISAGRGLAAVHAAGLVHRDFKPGNVLLGRDGRVRVSDFGIVGLSDGTAGSARVERSSAPIDAVTRPGVLVGTPRYMAPEQHAGSRVDARADQFSFAVSLFEALAGQPPYSGATLGELRAAQQAGAIRPLPDGVPSWLARVVRRGLDADPEKRFPSMDALVAALEAGWASSTRSRLQRWAPWLAVGAACAAGLAAAAIAWRRGPGEPAVRVSGAHRLTVSPGCEEYPHFLPDGRSVIYDALVGGDYEIVRLDLDSGASRPLTHDPGWDYGSAVSPDGRLAAYVHQGDARELRVIPTDGSGPPRTLGLIAAGYPSWTEDGAILVGDSGARVRRVSLDGVSVGLPVRLPSGSRLQHLLGVGDRGFAAIYLPSNDAPMSLAEIDPAGASRVVESALIDSEAGLALAPSRDAYYATARGAAGTAQVVRRRWGGAAAAIPGALAARAGLDVSRDGKHMVFSTCTGRRHLFVLSGDAPPRALPRGEWADDYPRRLDAHRFLATSSRSGDQRVWLIDDAGAARALTGPGTSWGSASWQGDRVVYVDVAQGGLLTVGLDGSAPRRLTSDKTDAGPTFTRDGQAVLFVRASPGELARVWRVPLDGGPAAPIGPPGTHFPAASPTDDLIVAVDVTGKGPEVVALENGRARFLGLPGLLPRFSPDGRRLVVVQDDVRVVEWAREGTAPPRTVWQAGTDAVFVADYLDDRQIVASVSEYDGDVWLAEGEFP